MRVLASVVVVAGALSGPVSAQTFFGLKPPVPLTVPAFRDAEITALIGSLDRLLASEPAPSQASQTGDDPEQVLWQFGRRIQAGRLSAPQEMRVLAHLDRLAGSRPELAMVAGATRRMVGSLTVGKTAPEIAGIDLDGRPFKLSDYRGKVVVLVFSAEWCAICRTQAPYERFLLARYERWPFALLGIQTGSSRDVARKAQLADRLTHRSWWDEPGKGETSGPIAGAWNVLGWPASYVIDGNGVIQFVDLRDEDLLKAVRQLVEAQVDRESRAQRSR